MSSQARDPRGLRALLHMETPPAAAGRPPHLPPPPGCHNLPNALTSFIGRARERAEVTRLLATTRLLTLTGAGGCGKTRLALAVAGDLVEDYPDGVWLVELAALADGALVPQAVATALGVREEAQRPLIPTLVDALRSRELLLVLDNCEHLIDPCAQLARRCSAPVRSSASWRPAARRWAWLARRPGWCPRSRCPTPPCCPLLSGAEPRWRQCGCSSSGRRRRCRPSR